MHCRYCYRMGHNIRTCSRLQEYIKLHPDSYQAQRFAERTIKQTPKSCSYCRVKGHNISRCEDLVRDEGKAIEENKKYRQDILENMKKHGIGVGTLFSYKEYNYQFGKEMEKICYITSVNWDKIIYKNSYSTIDVIVNMEGKSSMNLNKYFFACIESSKYDILGKISEKEVEKDIPSTWFNGLSNIKAAFPVGRFNKIGKVLS